jgi:hypothetical protein
MYFEKISKSDIHVTHPEVDGFQKLWHHLKARLNTFQMSTNVMGFQ